MLEVWGAGTPPAEGCSHYGAAHYGAARLPLREVPRRIDGEYLVALGGAETFARGVEVPYPALIAARLGAPVLNLGCINAGPDLWLSAPMLEGAIAGSGGGIVQIVGALNLSNRFYTVHPRRNDRFIAARPQLRRLYPEVDFTEINFTRHLAFTLRRACPERFALVAAELKTAWVARMIALLEQMPARRILYWVADHPPGDHADLPDEEPALVDRAMIARLLPLADGLIEQMAPRAGADVTPAGSVPRVPATAARFHREAAALLLPVLSGVEA